MIDKETHNPEVGMYNQEINIIDAISILIKRRQIFAVSFTVTIATSLIISLLTPNTYTSTATIIPVDNKSTSPLSSMLSSIGGGMGLLASQAGIGGGDTGDKFVAIMNSFTLHSSVINNNDYLKSLFPERWDNNRNQWVNQSFFNSNRNASNQPSTQSAVEALRSSVRIDKEKKSGLVRVIVSTTDPSLSANIANSFISELDKFLSNNNLSSTKNNRVFIENQLNTAREQLSTHERKLKDFQQKNKIISLDVQTEASLKTYSEIKSKILANEVELSALEHSNPLGDPRISIKKQEILELEKQLGKFENSPTNDPMMSFNKVPNLALEFAQLKRELLVREKVFELLTQQYEMSKIHEAEDDVSFQILDKAIPAEKKSSPKRAAHAVFALLAATTLAFISVFVVEFWATNKNKFYPIVK